VCERIFKIGLDLTKLQLKVWWLPCLEHGVHFVNVVDGPTEVKLGVYISNIAVYNQASFVLLHITQIVVHSRYRVRFIWLTRWAGQSPT